MNFRSAKSEPEFRILGQMFGKWSKQRAGRRAGRGAEEAFGVCRTTNSGLTRLLPRGTGPADPNAPSGASTAGPVLVNRRSCAVTCGLLSADSGSAFVGGVVSCLCLTIRTPSGLMHSGIWPQIPFQSAFSLSMAWPISRKMEMFFSMSSLRSIPVFC